MGKKIDERFTKHRLAWATTRVPEEWLNEAQYYRGGNSEFIREAIHSYKNNRHKHKFREILETLAGELLILSKWKEKGHPGGAEWTQELEEQLEFYERCFSILENSPFNDKL